MTSSPKSHELDLGSGNPGPGHIGSWIRVFSSKRLGVGVGLHCREKGGIERGKKKKREKNSEKRRCLSVCCCFHMSHITERERTSERRREEETGPIDPVLIERYNSPGFIGCLSRVQFNGVAPLKSALRKAADAQADSHPASASPVSYQGKLVQSNCGASPLTIPPMSAAPNPWPLDNTDAETPLNEERVIPDGVNRDSAIIGGIIAVVIFTILCTLVFLIRYMFRHKGTYHTNEAKGSGESATESADTAIIGTDNPETIDESKKEWFI
ncbi:contactin-associated protein-like 2 isoform X1 [Poecilia formosa]|uniref:contactin-associated protein-like 2 isoform X1 n=1 Tax=Poecilia formosa TaxID=48698 RepID=UPI0004441D28|nr:PREDICTED: contactin-associated protein-like 2 isoform X1 [Poecilia formosa]